MCRILLLFILSISMMTSFGQGQALFETEEETSEQIVQQNSDWQKQVKEELSTVARSIQDGSISFIFYFLFLCFVYGALHALGPGHGKFIVSAHYLAHPGSKLKASIMGLTIGLIHVVSAILLHLVIVYILKAAVGSTSQDVYKYATRISYSVLILLGSLFLVNHLRKQNQNESIEKGTLLSIALVPCPAAIITLTFCFALDIYAVGIIGALSLGLGIGIVVALFGLLSVSLKSTIVGFVNKTDIIGDKIHQVFSLLGNTLIILLGIVFLYLYW